MAVGVTRCRQEASGHQQGEQLPQQLWAAGAQGPNRGQGLPQTWLLASTLSSQAWSADPLPTRCHTRASASLRFHPCHQPLPFLEPVLLG